MSDIVSFKKNIVLYVNNPKDHDMICKVSRALASPDRVRILKSLLNHPKYLSDLSQELGIPVSSVSRHIDALAEAQLVFVNYQPGLKGHTKFCTQLAADYTVSLYAPTQEETEEKEYTVEMPVGMFSHCHIKPPCGMAGKTDEFIAPFDDPSAFFSPERIKAECIWFDTGFISYTFPAYPLSHHECREITFGFEICSETFFYNNNWPSDITVYVNEAEIATFTSPGDFGGRRGRYTPDYWPVTSTQFGLWKKVTVNGNGVFLDNVFLHGKVTFDDLKLYDGSGIKFKIGVKEDALHKGGLNLFGKNFGDYPQAIVMTVK